MAGKKGQAQPESGPAPGLAVEFEPAVVLDEDFLGQGQAHEAKGAHQPMMSQEDANRQAYLEEARELLNDLEASLLELEKTPDDTDLLHKIFRALHTVKGSGAMRPRFIEKPR